MTLHRDIFWLGRQWAVTGFGLQVVDRRHEARDLPAASLSDDAVLARLRADPWLNQTDFEKALAFARKRLSEQPRSLPVLPAQGETGYRRDTAAAVSRVRQDISRLLASGAPQTAGRLPSLEELRKRLKEPPARGVAADAEPRVSPKAPSTPGSAELQTPPAITSSVASSEIETTVDELRLRLESLLSVPPAPKRDVANGSSSAGESLAKLRASLDALRNQVNGFPAPPGAAVSGGDAWERRGPATESQPRGPAAMRSDASDEAPVSLDALRERLEETAAMPEVARQVPGADEQGSSSRSDGPVARPASDSPQQPTFEMLMQQWKQRLGGRSREDAAARSSTLPRLDVTIDRDVAIGQPSVPPPAVLPVAAAEKEEQVVTVDRLDANPEPLPHPVEDVQSSGLPNIATVSRSGKLDAAPSLSELLKDYDLLQNVHEQAPEPQPDRLQPAIADAESALVDATLALLRSLDQRAPKAAAIPVHAAGVRPLSNDSVSDEPAASLPGALTLEANLARFAEPWRVR